MSIRARDSYLLISKFGFLTRVDLRRPPTSPPSASNPVTALAAPLESVEGVRPGAPRVF